VKSSVKEFFPFFVIGFIILSLIRTFGDYLFIETFADTWFNFIFISKKISLIFILFAMVALGMQTNLKTIFLLGVKPLLIGFAASTIVGLISIIYLLAL
jgi:uncharacterized membrane protein YadS